MRKCLLPTVVPSYTTNQPAHYVKEKLETTGFPILNSKYSSYADFKIRVRNERQIDLLKDHYVAPDTVVNNANLSPLTTLNLPRPQPYIGLT